MPLAGLGPRGFPDWQRWVPYDTELEEFNGFALKEARTLPGVGLGYDVSRYLSLAVSLRVSSGLSPGFKLTCEWGKLKGTIPNSGIREFPLSQEIGPKGRWNAIIPNLASFVRLVISDMEGYVNEPEASMTLLATNRFQPYLITPTSPQLFSKAVISNAPGQGNNVWASSYWAGPATILIRQLAGTAKVPIELETLTVNNELIVIDEWELGNGEKVIQNVILPPGPVSIRCRANKGEATTTQVTLTPSFTGSS